MDKKLSKDVAKKEEKNFLYKKVFINLKNDDNLRFKIKLKYY